MYGTLVVVLLAELAVWRQWQVVNAVGNDAQVIVRGILNADGLWWWASHLVENFIQFPPLGIVLVGMLGIGLAERSGLLGHIIGTVAKSVPDRWLVPVTLWLGIMSSFALDAGYVVLPPIAAVLFARLGYAPIAGIVVSFAGVSAGFGANLLITSLDPLLAGFTQSAAQIIDAEYQVAVTANWWFMIASTLVLGIAGTQVTHRWVIPRTEKYTLNTDRIEKATLSGEMNPLQRKALRWALLTMFCFLLVTVYAIYVPGSFLHGVGEHFERWIEVTVPLLFLFFALPGWVFGRISGSIRDSRDMARMLADTMSDLGPYIVLAFFAAQFIAVFKYTHIGEVLAITGGHWLSAMQLPLWLLILLFVLLACLSNLLIGSMSAKYALLAPVFVPMLMLSGVPPELTQVAYRIGDSVTNVITPLNPYMIIILALLQKYYRDAGLGTLVRFMLPYSAVFLLVWLALLLIWLLVGIPLGPGSPI